MLHIGTFLSSTWYKWGVCSLDCCCPPRSTRQLLSPSPSGGGGSKANTSAHSMEVSESGNLAVEDADENRAVILERDLCVYFREPGFEIPQLRTAFFFVTSNGASMVFFRVHGLPTHLSM